MNPAMPLYCQPVDKIPPPTMKNIIRAAEFVGVSAEWALHGKVITQFDLMVANYQNAENPSMKGAAVVTGNANSIIIVKNSADTADELDAMESEFLQAFRVLNPRNTIRVFSFMVELDVEDSGV